MRIGITTFYTEDFSPLASITVPVMKEYADKHRYELFINTLPDNSSFHFIKTADTKKLLEIGFDIIMSIEADCLLTNLNYKIEDFINDEHDIFLTSDINGANSGVVIWKNTPFAKELLYSIQSKKDDPEYWDEQSFFERHFNPLKIKYLSHPSINSFPYSEYQPSYGKIGYKEGDIVEKPTVQEGDWIPGLFVCHMPGKTIFDRINFFNKIKDKIVW